jgi:ubiquinone/menaquinone biosynthesis C-methylase UbiE
MQQDKGTYFVNQELIEEMVRLKRQATLVTNAMGGVLSEQDERTLSQVRDVLDLACGPGEWVMRVAAEYPDWRVTGVDKSQRMIAYAAVQAEADEISNATFQVMDITQPLAFPPDSFDVVNIRFILAFMKREHWPLLLKECWRVLRPGGIIRITEQESGFSNDPLYQRYIDLWGDAWRNAGHAFSHSRAYIGVTVMLKPLLKQLGFLNVQHRPVSIDLSCGESIHRPMLENLIEALRLGRPFLLKWEVAPEYVLDQMYEAMRTLIDKPTFAAYWLLQAVWGQKPATR